MLKRNSPSSAAVLWLTALSVAYLSMRILVPVAGAVGAAAILASTVYPLHKRINRLAPRRRTGAAFATTAVVSIFIGGPILIASWFVTREAAHAYVSVRELIADQNFGLWTPPQFIAGLIGASAVDLRKILIDNLDAIGAPATRALGTVLRNVGAVIAGFVVFLAMFVLFLRDGPAITAAVERSLPMSAERKVILRAKLESAIAAAMQGVFLIALVQGAFAMLGFALFHVQFAVLLGALCAVLSPIPFVGSALIWIPIVARIALDGQTSRAMMLAAWFVFIVGLSDNVARPFLLRSKMQIPIPLIIVGVFGGISAFGISGAFFGPIIAAAALALLDAFDEPLGTAESERPRPE